MEKDQKNPVTLIQGEAAEESDIKGVLKEALTENLIQGEEAAEGLDEHNLRKERLIENLNQGESADESAEKKLWKERLRKEILEEEKERIMNFVDSEVTKKIFEVEKLLEARGKPAKLVLLPIDHANVPKLNLPSEQGGSLCYQLTDTGNGVSSSALTLDSGIKGSELESNLAKENSAENPKIPVEATKPEEQESEEKQHLRPKKKQKIGCTWSCPLCSVTATSEANLNNHFMGKKHKLKSTEVQKALNRESVAGKDMPTNGLQVKIQANGKLFLVYRKGNVMWCKNNNCTFACTSSAEMVVHLTETKHDVCQNAEEVKAADN